MKKHIKIHYVICLFVSVVILATSGCKETDVQPVDLEFPVTYNFVNELNQDLGIVNFTTLTYYPEEDVTRLSYRHFKPVLQQETVEIKIDTASFEGGMGYEGCTARSEFEIWVTLPGQKAYVSRWTTPVDTIKSINDSFITYRWPDDTSRWKKIDGIIVDFWQ